MSVFEILILEDKHGLFERSEDALIFTQIAISSRPLFEIKEIQNQKVA